MSDVTQRIEQLRLGPITRERYEWLCRLALALEKYIAVSEGDIVDGDEYERAYSAAWADLEAARTA